MTRPTHRLPRLFIERELSGSSLSLDEREAHYLKHVLRLKRGDRLVVFDGGGAERFAGVATLERRGATLELADSHIPLPDSPLELTLIQGLAKSDAMDFIVQKATELGVHALLPVYTEFSVVKLDAERSERRLEHWRKVAQSACEQCGRHQPPRIDAPATLAEALEALPTGPARFALDPYAPYAERSLARSPAAPPARIQVAVGPEGGFGPMDWRRLDAAQFARATLGPRVLRAETAALAVCAIAQACWGDI
jgi:16S rRNA (uracil1498-N3)-methyltransferase